MASFQRALRTYETHLNELLAHEGMYTVISDDEIGGTFANFEDALRAGYVKFGAGNFMVKEIRGQERVELVSCGIRIACPA